MMPGMYNVYVDDGTLWMSYLEQYYHPLYHTYMMMPEMYNVYVDDGTLWMSYLEQYYHPVVHADNGSHSPGTTTLIIYPLSPGASTERLFRW